MSDFKDIQSNLNNAKKGSAQSRQSLFLAEEKLRKIERAKKDLLRSNSADSVIIQNIIERDCMPVLCF